MMMVMQVREPMMSSSGARSDSVSVEINPKLINIKENAPLAKQESLEDMLKHEAQILMNGDAHAHETDEVEEELKNIVIVKETVKNEVTVVSSGSQDSVSKPQEVKVQIQTPSQILSQGSYQVVAPHKKIDESPINEPIVIVRHKAQVLQGDFPQRDSVPHRDSDESVLEKLLESDGSESHIDSSRARDVAEADVDNEEVIVDVADKRIKYSAAKKLSQDLIVTVENIPDEDLKVTEKLPEVGVLGQIHSRMSFCS